LALTFVAGSRPPQAWKSSLNNSKCLASQLLMASKVETEVPQKFLRSLIK
jgi:hypothetical protein